MLPTLTITSQLLKTTYVKLKYMVRNIFPICACIYGFQIMYNYASIILNKHMICDSLNIICIWVNVNILCGNLFAADCQYKLHFIYTYWILFFSTNLHCLPPRRRRGVYCFILVCLSFCLSVTIFRLIFFSIY